MEIKGITVSFVVQEESIDSWAKYVNNICVNVEYERYGVYTFRLKHPISYHQIDEMLIELCRRLDEDVPCKATFSLVEECTCAEAGLICRAKYAIQIVRFNDY